MVTKRDKETDFAERERNNDLTGAEKQREEYQERAKREAPYEGEVDPASMVISPHTKPRIESETKRSAPLRRPARDFGECRRHADRGHRNAMAGHPTDQRLQPVRDRQRSFAAARSPTSIQRISTANWRKICRRSSRGSRWARTRRRSRRGRRSRCSRRSGTAAESRHGRGNREDFPPEREPATKAKRETRAFKPSLGKRLALSAEHGPGAFDARANVTML